MSSSSRARTALRGALHSVRPDWKRHHVTPHLGDGAGRARKRGAELPCGSTPPPSPRHLPRPRESCPQAAHVAQAVVLVAARPLSIAAPCDPRARLRHLANVEDPRGAGGAGGSGTGG
eukprot:gene13250-biopygen2679